MSETNKKHVKRRFSPHLSIMVLLGMQLVWEPVSLHGQGLQTYGADMCAELGIPAAECTLSDPADSSEIANEVGGSDKTATLVEHARRVCTQEGVPMEDCKALPSSYRRTDGTILPAASFLTVPDMIPAPDPGLVPVPVIADAPLPSRQQGVRYARPPAPPAGSPLRYAAPPSPPVDPGFRYVDPPLLPIDPGLRYADPLPAEPAYRYVEPPVPVAERPERMARQERLPRLERFREPESFRRQERLSGRERVRRDERSGRCLRAVRYSRPPSYRYVTC